MKEKRIKLAIGPMFTSKYKIEVNNRTLKTPSILSGNGIDDFGIITDHPVIPIMNLPVEASMAIHYGLDEDVALKAITINPARNLKVSDKIGSIDVGKDADLVITDKHILDPTHRIIKTFVSGELSYSMNEERLFV
jgi:imidazolonepropionase-like amidohydrolase